MKNKKGFTLTELLAVIAILSIIMLIIVPSISGTLRNGKEKVVKNSTLDYIEAVETYLKSAALDNTKVELPYNQTYNVSEETTINNVPYAPLNSIIEAEGQYPTSGTVTIDDNYNVLTANLNLQGYDITYTKEGKIVTINR